SPFLVLGKSAASEQPQTQAGLPTLGWTSRPDRLTKFQSGTASGAQSRRLFSTFLLPNGRPAADSPTVRRRIARPGALSCPQALVRMFWSSTGAATFTSCVTRTAALAAIAVAAMLLAPAAGHAADTYPSRPIVLVIPLPPGGTNDIMARAVADKMSNALGQRIVIENRNAGGSGTVGTREVARAAPDGYTIILGYTSTLATGPRIFSNVGYDPRRDFAPLGLIASAPALLLVHRDLSARTVGELIALMKAAKEPYQVATPGAGTVNYLASVLFAQ